ncbi:MAG: hypothetical protein NC401_19710 [Ruminococcus sp.]|nr:hypothetical protein [Ruminococcus sp.]
MTGSITQTEYDVLNRAAIELLKTGVTELRCPRCGKHLIYEQKGSWEIVRCEDENCIKSIGRGI